MKEKKMSPYRVLKKEGTYKVGFDKPDVEFRQIGKRGVRRYDGYEKASGKALYTRDVNLPGMLFAKVMASPHARAKMVHLDTVEAEAYAGVRAVLRYDDPAIKDMELTGSIAGTTRMAPDSAGWAMLPVKTILSDQAVFEGQMVGVAIAADSEQIAAEALKKVRVEWAPQPFVLDNEAALTPEAPRIIPGAETNQIFDGRELTEHGDVEKGFKAADKVIRFEARRNAHLWAGAELPCVIARWSDERLEMWVHEQQPYLSKLILAEQLNVPMNKIHTHSLYQGCSFGERCNPSNWSQNGINVLAALLARRADRPVKLVLNRAENFYGFSGDLMVSKFKVGARRDGTITAVHMKNLFANYMCTTGVEHLVDNTRIVNLKCEGTTVFVNKPPAWWNRCEQLPNVFCQTLIFDHVADELGLDPTQVALANDGCNGHDTSFLKQFQQANGFPQRDSLAECIKAGKKAIDWDRKWHAPGARRLDNGRMHGMAFTWSHDWDDTRGTGSAAIMIQNDGSVSIIAQHSDVGVNPWTTYMQIVSDELGVRYEDIEINPFDLNVGFALMSPDGSCNLVSNGFVIKKAARKARRMLMDLAADKFNLPAEALDMKDSEIFEIADPTNRKPLAEMVKMATPMLNAVGIWTEPPVIDWAWHTQGLWGMALETGRPRMCRQANFIEVEVDTETGEVHVTRIVNVNDVGRAISPETVEGQMYGGTYMGLGRALTEELVWDPATGVLLNRNLLDYKYATMLDYPASDNVIVETELGHGPYGSTGIGENTATMIPALLGPAIYNAIGKRIDDFPITPDKVLKALGKI